MVNQIIKKKAVHRAKILEGQMKALVNAIEQEKYCIDLLLYSLSIQKSLQSLDKLLLENHLKSHVKHQMSRPGESERAVAELLKIFDLSRQK